MPRIKGHGIIPFVAIFASILVLYLYSSQKCESLRMSKVKVNDISLYYEIHGQGQPIVFIAGLANDHTSWQKVIEPYTKQYRVILVDNRGAGQSDCPDYPYTVEMMADDIAGLVQQLGIPAAHFVGSSLGGCIAQTIAHTYPQLVKSIVIANSFTSSFAQSNMRAHLSTRIRLELMNMQVKTGVSTATAIAKLNGIFGYSQSYLSQPGVLDQLEHGTVAVDARAVQNYTNQLHAINTFDSTGWLYAIKVPCLVIASDDDLLASVEQSKLIAQAIPGAQYFCFHKAGHALREEQPELFNKVVLDFLAKQR